MTFISAKNAKNAKKKMCDFNSFRCSKKEGLGKLYNLNLCSYHHRKCIRVYCKICYEQDPYLKFSKEDVLDKLSDRIDSELNNEEFFFVCTGCAIIESFKGKDLNKGIFLRTKLGKKLYGYFVNKIEEILDSLVKFLRLMGNMLNEL